LFRRSIRKQWQLSELHRLLPVRPLSDGPRRSRYQVWQLFD